MTEHTEATTGTALIAIPPSALPTILAADQNDILGKLAAELKAFKSDPTTESGRKAIGSMGAKIASAKMDLLRLGKSLTEDWRRQTDLVRQECKIIEDRMDTMKAEVLAPRDDYLAIDKRRVAEHEAALSMLASWDRIPPATSADEIEAHIRALESNNLLARDWEEFKQKASDARAAVLDSLGAELATARHHEAEAAELARLREESARRDAEERERLRQEHERKIAEAAAERARHDAERESERQRIEAERLAQAERNRIEAEAKAAADAAETERLRLIREAEEAAAAAERREKEASEAAKREREASERREREAEEARQKAVRDREAAEAREREAIAVAERARIVAEQRAKKEREEAEAAAIAAERKRQEREAAATKAEEERRAADLAHARKINREAAAQIMAAMSEVHSGNAAEAEKIAQAVVAAIAKKQVPHVTISY